MSAALATSAAERAELRALAAALARDKSGEAEVRRVAATERGWDPALWAELAAAGLSGLLVPTAYGGAGCGLAEAAVVAEELGRSLACVPYLSSAVLAVTALVASGNEAAQAELLPRLAAGELTAAVAFPSGSPALRATRDGLNGQALSVVDGHTAEVIVTAAAGGGLYLVRGDAPGLAATVQPAIDMTRRLARLDFGAVAAEPLGGGAEALARVRDAGLIALAAEQVGVAAQALQTAVSYAGQRVQFGRPIGSFQAVKHKCAGMLVALEGARAALDGAVRAADGLEDDPAGTSALVAALACGQAATHVTAEAIQVLGGIGFTWEHPAHLYFRRAHSSAVLLGSPPELRAELAGKLRL